MRKKLFLLLIFLLVSSSTFAQLERQADQDLLISQNRVVSGTITSAADGQPLPGATVMVKGTSTGVASDAQGRFSITVPATDGVLIFSFVGMRSAEFVIGASNEISIALVADNSQLDEVVVTAFGIERSKRSLTYATQEVKGDRVAAAGQPNLTNGLQGKVAGVTVKQSSGMPGASSFITIRGARSFDGRNTPLFVIDGLPIETEPSYVDGAAQERVSGTDASNRALDINPDDIESINVLKGAAASALYGLRAANGVVIITTKRGKMGASKDNKPVISFNTNYTADIVSRLPELQSTYAQGSGGNLSQGTSTSWGPRIDTLKPYAVRPGNIPASVLNRTQTPQVFDNVSPLFRTGNTLNMNLDVAKAFEKGNFLIGAGHTLQNGIIPGTDMKRYNVKFAGDFDLSPKVRIGTSVNYSNLTVNKIASGSNLSNPLFTTYYAPRNYDMWNTPYTFPGEQFRQINYRGAMDNPRWAIENNHFDEKTDRIFGSTYLNYQALSWLSFTARVGIDNYTTGSTEVYGLGSGNTGGRPTLANAPAGGQITNFTYSQQQFNSNLFATINYNLTEDLNLNANLGNETYQINGQSSRVRGTGIIIGGFDNMSNTAAQVVDATTSKERVSGFYANTVLGWRNMLYVNGSVRADYDSKMQSANRPFVYPSIGATFVFTEPFQIPKQVLSFGKLRLSYAAVGQSIGSAYGTKNIYATGGSSSGFLTDNIRFPLNGRVGFSQSNIYRNPNIVANNQNTLELGTELRFLNDRVVVDYTFFNTESVGQIFDVPVAPSTGFDSERRNGGTLTSKGHEVALNITAIQTKDFSWTVGANYTRFRNFTKELAPGVNNIYLGGFDVPNIRAQVGETYPVIFGSRFLRDPQGGIVVDSRQQIDGAANPYYGMPIADPVQGIIGRVQPDYEVNFSTSVTYKKLTLSAQLDWRQGGQMYAGNTRLLKLYGISKLTEDRTTTHIENGSKGYVDEDGNTVIVSATNDIPITRGEEYWRFNMDAIDESNVYSTGFVRMREVVISYQLPQSWLGKSGFRNASFYLTGRNLFLITDYPNFDPETSTNGSGNFQGMEYVALPQIRSFGGGLRFQF